MKNRLESLRRIAKVQAEMVKLAEWRIATADQRLEALRQDRAQLVDYVSGSGGLGVPIAKAALRAMLSIDGHRSDIESTRAAQRARLDVLRRRDRAVAVRLDAAAAEQRRAAEQAELKGVVEAWLAQRSAKATDA